MIKEVQILNYQIHKDILLEFHKGVNVISGSSGTGKSSIRRSIEWVNDNRPSGDSIRNYDNREKNVEVKIITSDNNEVLKIRDKKSKYIVNKDMDNPFDAIGKDVPIEVKSLLNLAEYNIQGQHDKYFLVQESPGERAKQLNAFVGLDVIDTLFANLNSEVNTTQKDLRKVENDKKELTEKLKEFADLRDIEKIINSIKLNVSLSEKFDDLVLGIGSCIEKITRTEQEIKECGNFIDLEKEVNKIFDLISQSEELDKIYEKLLQSISSIEENEIQLEEYNKVLLLEKYVLQFIEVINLYVGIDKEEVQMRIAIRVIESTEDELQEVNDNLILLEKKYSNMLKQLKICPFCGSKIKE